MIKKKKEKRTTDEEIRKKTGQGEIFFYKERYNRYT